MVEEGHVQGRIADKGGTDKYPRFVKHEINRSARIDQGVFAAYPGRLAVYPCRLVRWVRRCLRRQWCYTDVVTLTLGHREANRHPIVGNGRLRVPVGESRLRSVLLSLCQEILVQPVRAEGTARGAELEQRVGEAGGKSTGAFLPKVLFWAISSDSLLRAMAACQRRVSYGTSVQEQEDI